MKIFITGGTGFIGSELIKHLKSENHHLIILTRNRNLKSNEKSVQYCYSLDDFSNLNDFDAVINFAGEPIFNKYWTHKQKNNLLQSRVEITARLSELINCSSTPPHTFLSASATGIYGNLPSSADFYTESAACENTLFTAQLCQEWENAALKAQSNKTRVCLIRTGIVISPNGGALKKMLPLYRWGLGGKLASGKQYWAWISLRDHIQAVIFLLHCAKCSGIFNFVAPNPITNKKFNQLLSKTVNRPAIANVPGFVLKLLLGERAHLLLDNQPLYPQKLLEAGFQFQDAVLTKEIFLNT